MTGLSISPIALLVAVSLWATDAAAQVVPLRPDLGRASLEDLMKIQITSASRKEQPVDEVAAAVFVLTQDDIRRSGMRTIPELLRLVPGVQVGRLNSSSWAVSIRGFNDQFSNKLLVLVDGRSVYQRVFSGVFWDVEDLVFEDIERIEVIRGPGASVWGANAVNGVINVVTKSAQETQGALVRVGAGRFDRAQVSARYGGSLGSGAYRIYTQWTDRGDTQPTAGLPDDDWRVFTGGGRADWTRGADDWMVDASATSGDAHTIWSFPESMTPDLAPHISKPTSSQSGHVLGRWTRRSADGSSLQVQTSAAHLHRVDFIPLDETTLVADGQYHAKLGARHDLVAGGGVRFVKSRTGTSFAISFDPSNVNTLVSNLFLQDEVSLPGRLHLTLGSKIEHEPISGWGLQPTGRLMWSASANHHVWIAASRALRTPSLTDALIRFNAVVLPGDLPTVVGVVGNAGYKAETLQDVEAGYRFQIASAASIDITTFRGHYGGLPTNEPLGVVFEATPDPPHLFVVSRLENRLDADTAGVEVAARVAPTPAWRLDGSYSTFHLTPHPDAGSQDPAAAVFDGHAPARQWLLHSSLDVGTRTQIDGTLFHVGPLTPLAVPAYTRADVRVEVVLTGHLTVSAVGKNLLDATHVEFTSPQVTGTRIPRSANVRLVWKY
jgi:iron complex outermembrane recepter protein